MINKETYKRLTERRGGLVIDNCGNCPNVNNLQGCTDKNCYEIMKNRLAELEDKIENGMLIELPCKVGSSVYAVNHSKYNISGGYVSEEFVDKIHISSHTILVKTTENGIWISKSYLPQDFGDIVFTIKAEAEAKLKELQEGK